ncbi:MAG: hypothetical protein AB7T06_40405 [Kofleriaceae bacterium]
MRGHVATDELVVERKRAAETERALRDRIAHLESEAVSEKRRYESLLATLADANTKLREETCRVVELMSERARLIESNEALRALVAKGSHQ